MKFDHFDLNLLRVLDALLTHGSVSKAAVSLSVTQSAVSQSLKKLRDALEDPLLVKSGRVMIMSKRAEELAPEVKRILKSIEQALTEKTIFNPGKSKRIFRIRTSEYFECVIAPVLYEKLNKINSDILVHLEYLEFEVNDIELLEQRIDLVVGIDQFMTIPDALSYTVFPDDRLVCLAGEGFPLDGFENVHEFHKYKQITDSLMSPGIEALASANSLNLLIVESYTAIVSMLLKLDFVAILPLQVAHQLLRFGGLKMILPPPELPNFRLNMVWHPVFHSDPAHIWLRNIIEECYGVVLKGNDAP